jgi:Mg-chelatase subunit ChlD
VAWRRVQIRLPLPASIHPLDPPRSYQPDRNPTLERTFNAVPGRTAVGALSATWWIRSSEPGNYFIGEHAEVQLEDERGNLSATTLDATSLSVGATCVRPNTARLFLPILVQPRCQASDVPADIVLLLDQSSSLQPHDLEQTGQRAFDQDARVLAPLGSSRTAVEQALGRLRLTPGTRIEVALQAAVGELTGGRSLPGRRRTIALISDGVNTSPHGDEPVVTWGGLTRAKGITIVTVAIGDRPNHALLDALADRPELALTAATSGDLDSAYRAVADVAACDWYDW